MTTATSAGPPSANTTTTCTRAIARPTKPIGSVRNALTISKRCSTGHWRTVRNPNRNKQAVGHWALPRPPGSARRIFLRGSKTNLSICLRRCESSSLGRFAEQLFTCLNLPAAEVPCKTAPFASFSGRAEKEGPARPERVPIFSSFVRALKKASVMSNFYEIVRTKRYSFFDRIHGPLC